jgi:hypothetical protein
MSNDKRTKRPSLDRTQPIRSWSTLLGVPGGPGADPADAAAGDGKHPPRLEDAISRSVELGYRVVDDYIQQGQRAAQRLSAGTLTAEAVASEAQDLGGRIARYASDFFGAWVELLDLAAAGSAARQAAPAASAPQSGTSPPPEQPPARRPAAGMRVQVVAARPVEVALDLRPERVSGPLRAHELRSADARKPRLADVTIHTDGAGATPVLRIGVPDGHPAGAYEGLLLDEATNRPVGSVRVVLGAPLARPRRRSAKRRK